MKIIFDVSILAWSGELHIVFEEISKTVVEFCSKFDIGSHRKTVLGNPEDLRTSYFAAIAIIYGIDQSYGFISMCNVETKWGRECNSLALTATFALKKPDIFFLRILLNLGEKSSFCRLS